MSEERYEQEIECSNDCSSCSANCGSRKPSKEDFLEPMNPYSHVKRVIGVVSGKGGVGKSFVTSYLAVLMNRMGYKTAILDADITGPSIPKAFGITRKAAANELGILPEYTKEGIATMSVNLLLEDEEIPVIWRGPVIAGTVKQFWSQVVWGDIDYMFVDMPPGTGDVPLTVFQSLPLDGIIVVTSPQELVSMVVAKAVNMARQMEVPVLGLIENYSYVQCKNCNERMEVFGKSRIEETAKRFDLPVLAKLPLDGEIAELVDAGKIEQLHGDWLDQTAAFLKENYVPAEGAKDKTMEYTIAVTTDDEGNVFGHFGHCEKFTLFHMNNGQLVGKEEITNAGHGHTDTANLLIGKQVKVLVCGGIGSAAMDMLLEAGILVVPGAEGDINVAVASFLDGSLAAGTTSNCGSHDHEDGGCCCGGGCCH